jgi:hypothetical protein
LKLKEIELKYTNPKLLEETPLYKLGWLPGKDGYEYDGKKESEAKKISFTFGKTYAEAANSYYDKALVDNSSCYGWNRC